MLEQTPQTPNPEEREQLAGEFAFVYCYHSPDNAQAIVDAVADCDTVAIETVELRTEADRQAWSDDLNWLANVDISTADPTELEQRRKAVSASPFHAALMRAGLESSGKRIEVIDMTQDDPDYGAVRTAFDDLGKYTSKLGYGSTYGSVEELRELLTKSVISMEHATLIRDATMASQLQTLGRHPGKNGVITGLAHSGIETALLANANADTSHVVIRSQNHTEANGDPDSTDFTQQERLARQVDRDKGSIVDPKLVDLRLVEDLAVLYAGLKYGDHNHNRLKLLSQDKVTDLLHQIDTLRSDAANSGNPADHGNLPDKTKEVISAAMYARERRHALVEPFGASTPMTQTEQLSAQKARVVAAAALATVVMAKEITDYVNTRAA